ncbi:hypothetical protein ACUXG3_005588 [Bacillus thuringiensis]|uniref:hypothetical protein n=1 Tax=Bacillus thuringiensis TaxID=1428 RepID=UPI001874B05E|nr:hypothetical protein [Bacillus thuringiensis]MBE4941283.1 hypothetical protein [Bacillus thuringiensis]
MRSDVVQKNRHKQKHCLYLFFKSFSYKNYSEANLIELELEHGADAIVHPKFKRLYFDNNEITVSVYIEYNLLDDSIVATQ